MSRRTPALLAALSLAATGVLAGGALPTQAAPTKGGPAPGSPGTKTAWSEADMAGFGTARARGSNVWFTPDASALAGWQALDVGAIDQAWRCFETSTAASRQAGNQSLHAFARLEQAPESHVDLGDPPTFLTHGDADQFMPSEQSELLANRLEEAGVPHRLIELPGARHGFDAIWGGWSSQIVRHELEGFLDHHLADQDPDAR